MTRVSIDVMLRDEILDPQGQAVERALPAMGFAGVAGVRIGKHIELTIPDDQPEAEVRRTVEAMATTLLANPVIERFDWRVED
jgi:phosphoribosylformylglycinamidine synthase subunit PurS